MLHDPYVLGACLYEVGHAGDWESFRHLGAEVVEPTIHLIDRIVTLQESTRAAAPTAAAAPALAPSAHPLAPDVLEDRWRRDTRRQAAGCRHRTLDRLAETVGALPGAALNAIGYVTWTRRLTGFSGSIWNCWAKEAAVGRRHALAGIQVVGGQLQPKACQRRWTTTCHAHLLPARKQKWHC